MNVCFRECFGILMSFYRSVLNINGHEWDQWWYLLRPGFRVVRWVSRMWWRRHPSWHVRHFLCVTSTTFTGSFAYYEGQSVKKKKTGPGLLGGQRCDMYPMVRVLLSIGQPCESTTQLEQMMSSAYSLDETIRSLTNKTYVHNGCCLIRKTIFSAMFRQYIGDVNIS